MDTTPTPIPDDPTVFQAFQEVGAYMLQHKIAFIVIFAFVIGSTITLTALFYKNRTEELVTKEKRLRQQEKDLKEKQRQLQAEIDEINSPQYQAYLLARGITRRPLTDSNMFNNTIIDKVKSKINGKRHK